MWYGGQTSAEVIMLWHKGPYPALTGPEKWMEFDVQIPAGFVNDCTTWTDLPRYYDDCGTGGTLDGNYESYGFGSYLPSEIYSSRWYTARYTIARGTSTNTSTAVKFGAQEVKMAGWCAYTQSDPWCLTAHQSTRVHTGVPWRTGAVSKSSWLTPQGAVVARDYKCDVWHDVGCG